VRITAHCGAQLKALKVGPRFVQNLAPCGTTIDEALRDEELNHVLEGRDGR